MTSAAIAAGFPAGAGNQETSGAADPPTLIPRAALRLLCQYRFSQFELKPPTVLADFRFGPNFKRA